jgi:hypothetical protein
MGVYARAYPHINIDRELWQSAAWLRSNRRRAPKKDWGRFLNNWFRKAENDYLRSHGRDDAVRMAEHRRKVAEWARAK